MEFGNEHHFSSFLRQLSLMLLVVCRSVLRLHPRGPFPSVPLQHRLRLLRLSVRARHGRGGRERRKGLHGLRRQRTRKLAEEGHSQGGARGVSHQSGSMAQAHLQLYDQPAMLVKIKQAQNVIVMKTLFIGNADKITRLRELSSSSNSTNIASSPKLSPYLILLSIYAAFVTLKK